MVKILQRNAFLLKMAKIVICSIKSEILPPFQVFHIGRPEISLGESYSCSSGKWEVEELVSQTSGGTSRLDTFYLGLLNTDNTRDPGKVLHSCQRGILHYYSCSSGRQPDIGAGSDHGAGRGGAGPVRGDGGGGDSGVRPLLQLGHGGHLWHPPSAFTCRT